MIHAAAYVAECGRMKRGDVAFYTDIAKHAALMATEAVEGLTDGVDEISLPGVRQAAEEALR